MDIKGIESPPITQNRISPLTQAIHDANLNLPAGILLYRLRYWMQYAVKQRGGHVWVIKTQDEWARETALSPRQVQRAFEHLRLRGCIETQQHFFGRRSMNWIRTLAGRKTDLVDPGLPDLVDPGLPDLVCPNHRDTTIEIQTLKNLSDPASGITVNPKGSEEISGEKMKVGDVAQAWEEKQVKTLSELQIQAEGVVSLANYHDLWRDCIAFRKDKFMPPLIGKQKKQITLMQKAIPPGAMGPFIFLVVTEWSKARLHLKEKNGFKKPPVHPSTGLVLACIEPLTDWMMLYAKTSKPKSEGKKDKWGL